MNKEQLNLLMLGINAKIDADARASGIWTLGTLIKALSLLPSDTMLESGLTYPHSYRGYYERLAFESAGPQTAGEALEVAREALGETYCGYKGGEYTMHERTLCYIASYGSTGKEIHNLVQGEDGRFQFSLVQPEW